MSREPALQLGIDVGGTSIKGAVVDLEAGELEGLVHTESTPPAATPEDVAAAIRRIAKTLEWGRPVGVALPGVIDGSSLRHAPNLSDSWERAGALTCLRAADRVSAVLINDADAAGLAELMYGDGNIGSAGLMYGEGGVGSAGLMYGEGGVGSAGLTIVLTFGTGIGSALLHNGSLIANSELGGLVGADGRFEEVASGRAISTEALTPIEWAKRAQPYFDELQAILNPSRWVVGGGLSDDFERYSSKLRLSKPISVAHRGMHAGVVGAAVAAGRPHLLAARL